MCNVKIKSLKLPEQEPFHFFLWKLSRVQRQMMEEPQHASSLIGNEGLELAPKLHGALRHAAALNALRRLSSDALTAQENSLFFINIVPRMNEG